jgi:hypothetical protein
LLGEGTGTEAPGATGAGESHAAPGLPGGLGTGVAVPFVGAGTGFTAHGDVVGTGTGMADEVIVGTGTGVADEAPAGLATGAAARFPVPGAVAVAGNGPAPGVPAAGVPVPVVPTVLGVPPGASVAGLLTVAPAALAGPDAAWPEPDAAEQPARARLAATPSVQPAATRAVLLSDRTCMLLEVVSLQ